MFNHSYRATHRTHPHYFSPWRLKVVGRFSKLSTYQAGLVPILKNIADPTKLKIYRALSRVEEISVGDLAYVLNINQSSLSHALTDLKNLGLVESHRCGQLVCYSLCGETKIRRALQILAVK